MINENITSVDRHTFVIDDIPQLLNHLKSKKLVQRIIYDSNQDWYLVSSNDQLPHPFIIEQVYEDGFYGDTDIISYIENGANREKNTNNYNPKYLYYMLYSPSEQLLKNFFDGINHGYSFKDFGTIYTKGFGLPNEIRDRLELVDLKEEAVLYKSNQPTTGSRQHKVDSVVQSSQSPNNILDYVKGKIKMNESIYKETLSSLVEKLKKTIIEPQKQILDDMEDETGLNIEECMVSSQLGAAPTPNLGRSIKKIKKELEEIDEDINDLGTKGIDDSIIEWLDKLSFKNTKSQKGFKYLYSGNCEHIVYYTKQPEKILKYRIYKDNKTTYDNAWYISSFEDVNQVFQNISKIFDSYE